MKDCKSSCDGVSSCNLGGVEGKCDAFGDDLDQKLAFPSMAAGFYFFYRTVFRFLDQSADIPVINFTAEPVHFGIFQWC